MQVYFTVNVERKFWALSWCPLNRGCPLNMGPLNTAFTVPLGRRLRTTRSTTLRRVAGQLLTLANRGELYCCWSLASLLY